MKVSDLLNQNFGLNPTSQQLEVFKKLERFLITTRELIFARKNAVSDLEIIVVRILV